jgi:putative oxidoreductase
VRYVALAGRLLFSILFIVASAGHFSRQTIEASGHHGVPLAGLLVPLAGVIALMGGLSILVGFQTRMGAWLLVIFLIPVTLLMHNFWAAADPVTSQIEKAMFMKNITMLGGALLISYFGAGPLSLDAFGHPQRRIAPEEWVVDSMLDAPAQHPPVVDVVHDRPVEIAADHADLHDAYSRVQRGSRV